MAAVVDERTVVRTFGPWWLFLITGIAWLFVAKIVLDANLETVAAIAVLAGFMFSFAAVNEFMVAAAVRSWRWLHIVFGVLFALAGIMAFVRPGGTFLSLAAIIGWFLIFKGTLDLVVSLAGRDEYELWWLGLVTGIIELLIGFWAAGSPRRSIALLVIWVGAGALARGVMEIVLAFRLRSLQKV